MAQPIVENGSFGRRKHPLRLLFAYLKLAHCYAKLKIDVVAVASDVDRAIATKLFSVCTDKLRSQIFLIGLEYQNTKAFPLDVTDCTVVWVKYRAS
ncbi:MAG TPA: hypothetical protein IGS40_03215 [Trichormus sp. M33_DOE_039]|nr:hypothetical protein [Trichormus sp. M33_DOE_039]